MRVLDAIQFPPSSEQFLKAIPAQLSNPSSFRDAEMLSNKKFGDFVFVVLHFEKNVGFPRIASSARGDGAVHHSSGESASGDSNGRRRARRRGLSSLRSKSQGEDCHRHGSWLRVWKGVLYACCVLWVSSRNIRGDAELPVELLFSRRRGADAISFGQSKGRRQ